MGYIDTLIASVNGKAAALYHEIKIIDSNKKGIDMDSQQEENRKFFTKRALADDINKRASHLIVPEPELKYDGNTGRIFVHAGLLCRVLQCRYGDLTCLWVHTPSYRPSLKMYDFNQFCRSIVHREDFINININRIH